MIIEGENSIVKNIFVTEMSNADDFIEFSIANDEIKVQDFIRNNFVDECFLNQAMHFADNICSAFNRFNCFSLNNLNVFFMTKLINHFKSAMIQSKMSNSCNDFLLIADLHHVGK